MFRKLKWGMPSLFKQIDIASFVPDANQVYLEAIFSCMAYASGVTTGIDRARKAQAELTAHSQRCVFPIGDVLTSLPLNDRRTSVDVSEMYYIFPLWDDTIKDWRGPVIFAHVFDRSGEVKADPLAAYNEMTQLGQQIQTLLIPFGSAIAHSYYNKELKKIEELELAQKHAWEQAKAWAHEVKNYTAPVIDSLNDARLRNKQIVTSQEAQNIISRSRQSILILNAASYAVQLALSRRLGTEKPSEKNRLQRLPREQAIAIVESSLQYLLNYHAEAAEDFILRWAPRRTMQQVIEDLACILSEKEDKATLTGKEKANERILTDGRVIWVIALLREVIWNIRIESPFSNPGEINISYSLSLEDGELILNFIQEQVETAGWSKDREPPNGIRLANALFGKAGAGFGFIDMLETKNVKKGKRQGVLISYPLQIHFAVS